MLVGIDVFMQALAEILMRRRILTHRHTKSNELISLAPHLQIALKRGWLEEMNFEEAVGACEIVAAWPFVGMLRLV